LVDDAMRTLGETPMFTEARAPAVRDDETRLAPYREGMRITVEFDPGSTRERSVDAAQLRQIAELMRQDPTLRAEVIALAAESDASPHGSLSLLRARRVKGLIAILGPSRSRFSLRRGTETGVFVRLFR
jgi:hypothetical protein